METHALFTHGQCPGKHIADIGAVIGARHIRVAGIIHALGIRKDAARTEPRARYARFSRRDVHAVDRHVDAVAAIDGAVGDSAPEFGPWLQHEDVERSGCRARRVDGEHRAGEAAADDRETHTGERGLRG